MNWNNNISLKKKIKLIIIYVSIGISLAYLLTGFELAGWKQAIDLGSNIFYINQGTTDLNVPHAQDTVQNLIRWNFGPQAKLATAIFTAESGLRCDSISKTGDYGLAQIHLQAHRQYTTAQLLDCKTNIEIAARIYHQQGNFTAWSAYKNHSYLTYLQ